MPRFPSSKRARPCGARRWKSSMATASPISTRRPSLSNSKNERLGQEQGVLEVAAARQALERQIERTRAALEHPILKDLVDGEKKSACTRQDPVHAQRQLA